MTAHAVYVCRNCGFVVISGDREKADRRNADEAASYFARAHETKNPGHETVLHRVKMEWEIG